MMLVVLVEYRHGRVYALQMRDVKQLLDIILYIANTSCWELPCRRRERERREKGELTEREE